MTGTYEIVFETSDEITGVRYEENNHKEIIYAF
jgi:hypothetical protein